MTDFATIEINGHSVPQMFYGTAWKEDRTETLTELALGQGFRAIDTANQRKHYDEEGVGRGLASFHNSAANPPAVFLQTKYTFAAGQDHRLPYDPQSPIEEQVQQSFASSQKHLGVETLDSLVLHGPMYGRGLATQDWEAWRAMEGLVEEGKVRFLGISNVASDQLIMLLNQSRIKPSFVQNRCFAVLGWDREIRQICREFNILYQGFSLLTANRKIFSDPTLGSIVSQHKCTPAQLIYSFALHLKMIVLTGTTNQQHMQEALQASQIELGEASVKYLETQWSKR